MIPRCAIPGVLCLLALSALGCGGNGNLLGRGNHPPSAGVSTRYTLTDLGTLGGNGPSFAYGINDLGQVVGGASVASGDEHAFLWQGGVMTDLGTLGGGFSRAEAINNAGQAVGFASLPSGEYRAFLWTASGGITDLGVLPHAEWSDATAINDAGLVVGVSSSRVFFWTASGGMTELFAGTAYDVNDRGQMLGSSFLQPFLWTATEGRTPLPIPSVGGGTITPLRINNRGQVVGSDFLSQLPQERSIAFSWTASGGRIDLGALPGGGFSIALGVNDSGVVVGRSSGRAFAWSEASGTVDLNDRISAGSGWILLDARAVNERGQIVGVGTRNNQLRAFLLTPR